MTLRRLSVALLLLLLSLMGLRNRDTLDTVSVALAEQAASTPALYLPLVVGANSGATTPTKTPTPTSTTTPAQKAAFFATMQWKTSRSAIATDAAGGIHLAYTFYEAVAPNAPTSGVYLYCAQACSNGESWSGVSMGELVKDIQLALTPQGRPRILYRTDTADNGSAFFYAVCEQDCTNPGQWTITQVASNRGMTPVELRPDEQPNRYFALDPEGRPRFVYSDRNTWITPDHVGTFYAFCNQACTQAENWSETRINQDNGNHSRFEKFLYPSLAFTRAGQPRVVADGTSMQDEFFLYYLACDAGCDNIAGWQRAPLFERGSGPNIAYDVEIDAAGHPRVVFYQGALLEAKGDRLSYAWCNGNCLDAGGWQRVELGLAAGDGQDPDLELDAAGRPRIAYALSSAGGLGYAQCSARCEEAGAAWQFEVVETHTDLANAWTVPIPPHCDGGIWGGLTPSLSLTANGTPRMAYDATYHARCWYDDETDQWEPWPQFSLVKRAVRVVLMPGSTGGSSPVTVTPTPTGSATPTHTATPPNTPTATPTPTEPPAPSLGTGAFLDTQWNTGSSAIAVDGNNGIHVAYVYHEPVYAADPHGAANPTAAVYRYCPADCGKPANWQGVSLGEAVSEVQIGLTPGGQPRLLLLARAEDAWGRADRYLFAACDERCTDQGHWQIETIVTTPAELSWHWDADPADVWDSPRQYQARRYFALDPQGRPRFVYYHYNESVDLEGAGAYYAWCDAACTDGGNWSHTRITKVEDWSGVREYELIEKPTLTFTADGRPRLLAAFLPLGILRFPGLYYFTCDQACDNGENWHNVLVGANGDEAAHWSFALDGAGRPRVALSSYVPMHGYVVRYLWCDTNCLDTFNWQSAELPGEGEHPHLAINAQGQPRIVVADTVYDATGNNPVETLFILGCNSHCQSTGAEWQRTMVENGKHLAAAWSGSMPPACAGGQWHSLFPSLVLGAAGRSFVVYDAIYVAECTYDAGAGSWIVVDGEFSTPWRAVRAVDFPQP